MANAQGTEGKNLQAGLDFKSSKKLRGLIFLKNMFCLVCFFNNKKASLDASWVQGPARREGIYVPRSPPLSGFFHSLRYLNPPSAQDNGESVKMAF